MIIYLITNLINNKKYVGQTIRTLRQRWLQHQSQARGNRLYAISGAIRKYGPEAFKIETLFTCSDKTTLDMYEKGHIKFFDTRNGDKGYNLTDGGEGLLNPSPEHRAAIGRASKGRIVSESTRQLLRTSHIGQKVSKEHVLERMQRYALKRPTHCLNGHEYTPENTQTPPSGGRRCKTCRRVGEGLVEPGTRNKLKTHCKSGHEFTIANTHMENNARRCRTCSKLRARAYRARKIS